MDRAAHLAVTARDIRIISTVYAFNGCTIEQVRRRFFSPAGSGSACYSRISRLIDSGYLTALRLPSLTGIGSGKTFLTLGPTARPHLADLLGVPRSELQRTTRAISPLVIAHHLAIGDVRLALDMATERSPLFSLTEWETDLDLHREPLQLRDPLTHKQNTIVPDSAFILERSDGAEQRFLLELDRGTVSPKRLRVKLRCYLAQAQDERVPVLFVTTNRPRLEALARWTTEVAATLQADPTLVWLGLTDQINEQNVIAAPIWRVVGGPPALALIDVTRSEARAGDTEQFGGVVVVGGS